MLECYAAFALLGIEVKEGVEGHELCACALVDLLLRHALAEVVFHGAVGVWVSVAIGQAEELSVLAEEGKVASPGVDTYALELDVFGSDLTQGTQDLVVEVWEVPEDVPAEGQLWVLKPGELAHVYALSIEGGKDGASAGGTEVNGKIVHEGEKIKRERKSKREKVKMR